MTKKADHTAQRIANSLITPFLDAWFAMLLLGGAHSMDSRVPALGYLTTLALVYILINVGSTASSGAILADRVRR